MRLVLAPTVLAVALVAAAVAGAATINGTARADFLRGTTRPDVIHAGRGNDRIAAQDGGPDQVFCGSGRDIVNADLTDKVAADCELVSRQVYRDRLSGGSGQHETVVEVDSFAVGDKVVSAFQVGRIFGGGAMAIGFATSRDGGRRWTSGLLPGLTPFSSQPGPETLVSDPAVSYDEVHGVWLVVILAETAGRTTLYVSRSNDGVAWQPPVVVTSLAPGRLAFDKEWIACDNGPFSQFRGRCYVTYTDLVRRRLGTQSSTDGGLTWSAEVGAAPELRDNVVGMQPAILPNGTIVNVFLAEGNSPAIASVRSTDGAASFEPTVRIAPVDASGKEGLRGVFPLPSAEVDRNGLVQAAWNDCRLRAGCAGNDIVLASSADGVNWSTPARVPLAPGTATSYILPGLAANPGARGPALSLLFYSYPTRCAPVSCRLSVGLATRAASGSWSAPRRLDATAMRVTWLADTQTGRFVGDYVANSFVASGKTVSFFPVASPPRNGRFREGLFAYRS